MPNWNQVLGELQDFHRHGLNAHDILRRKYLAALFQRTNRNVIAYYTAFLSKPPHIDHSIVDEDKNGFMAAIHGLNRNLGLDLILHTPGGGMAATESLVDYLRRMFGTDIRAIVPQIAMSAGTMIACSCKSIVMGKQSNLGPIDPQFGAVPAAGVLEEFRRAHQEIKDDPSKLAVWRPILEKYTPTFLHRCEHAVARAQTFVQAKLDDNMLCDIKQKRARVAKAKSIVDKLSDFESNRGHDRHIQIDECIAIGLKVEKLEDDPQLQDAVLTVHHCYMHTMQNTPANKLIENHAGAAMVKRQQMVQQIIATPS
jgi:hypothetical protein